MINNRLWKISTTGRENWLTSGHGRWLTTDRGATSTK